MLARVETCKFRISVLELAGLHITFFSKKGFACFSTAVTSALQLAIDHDDDGITRDRARDNRLKGASCPYILGRGYSYGSVRIEF